MESAPGVSPKSFMKEMGSPLAAACATWARFILDAATIFMALVIFLMFWTDLMRILTTGGAPGSAGAGAGSREQEQEQDKE